MALKVLADSWAIIELMQKGPKWEEVRRNIASASEVLFTPLLVSEAYYRIKQNDGGTAAMGAVKFVNEMARICEITLEVAILAGNIHLEEKLPLVDAFTLAVARKEGAKILTGDPHFKKIKEAIYVGD
jgi:predicted nucleic acid-binding protein